MCANISKETHLKTRLMKEYVHIILHVNNNKSFTRSLQKKDVVA